MVFKPAWNRWQMFYPLISKSIWERVKYHSMFLNRFYKKREKNKRGVNTHQFSQVTPAQAGWNDCEKPRKGFQIFHQRGLCCIWIDLPQLFPIILTSAALQILARAHLKLVSCLCINKQGTNHFTAVWQSIKGCSVTGRAVLGLGGPTSCTCWHSWDFYSWQMNNHAAFAYTNTLHLSFPFSSSHLKEKRGKSYWVNGVGIVLLTIYCTTPIYFIQILAEAQLPDFLIGNVMRH